MMLVRSGKMLSNSTIQLLQHFAKRWRHEYLTSLREFHHPSNRGGQQVKVYDDCPWTNWKMAIIESLNMGNDGRVRSANICTGNGTTNRPVTQLYPLEVTDKGDAESIHDEVVTEDSCDQPTSNRPQCAAAQRAREQITVGRTHPCPPGGFQRLLTLRIHLTIIHVIYDVIVCCNWKF